MKENVKSGADNFFRLVGFVAVVAVIVAFVNHFRDNIAKDKKIAEALPGYEAGVSAVEIQAALTAIGEFATAEYSYSGQAFVEKSRKVLGVRIPLTQHSFSVSYDGVIKFGYAIEEIDIEVQGNMIVLTLPNPVVLDNYIAEYKTRENNNVFNPINSNEVSAKLEEIKKLELEKAEEKGAYKLAMKNVKFILAEFLGRFEGYSVTFR